MSRADCARENVNFIIEKYFSTFPDILLANGGDINETAGDGPMVIFEGDAAQAPMSAAKDGHIPVDPATADQVKSELTLPHRGLMEFDNVAEPVPVLSLVRNGVGNG